MSAKVLPRLVVIYRGWDGNWVYSAFTGRIRTHKYQYHSALGAEWVEEIRSDPGQFDNEEPQAA